VTKPVVAEDLEKRLHHRGQLMQPSDELAFGEHVRDPVGMMEQPSGLLEVAAEESGGYQGGGEDFGVRHLGLRVFTMAVRLEKVVDETVDCNDGGVHGGFLVELASYPEKNSSMGTAFFNIV